MTRSAKISLPAAVAVGLLLLLYYAAVVLLHDWVQQRLMVLFNLWSFYGYEARFVAAWYALFIPLSVFLTIRLKRRGGAALLGIWIGLLLIIVATDKLWLVTMSERIHYLQYGALALGLRFLLGGNICGKVHPAVSGAAFRVCRWSEAKSNIAAFITAVLLGAGDEAYQALVLYADRPELPLDFKDMLLNSMGAALGLLLFQALTRARSPAPDSRR